MKGRVGSRDHALGAALALAYVGWLVATAPAIGMSRDEGFYVVAAQRYGAWFEQLLDDRTVATTREVVDRQWSYNHEHPPLMKGLFALSHLAQEKWDLFETPSTAYRFPAMVLAGLLLWLIYIFGARAYGRQVGIFAALSFALIPRVFYHAHLNAFDVPIALMLTWVTYCYWRSLTRPRWAIMTGIAYGLALATKHNAWVLPAILLIHWSFVVVSERRRRKRGGAKQISYVPWWLLAMVAFGPPLFVYSWPWLWFDTTERFREYAAFHLNHEHYNMAYFGVNYFRPPLPIGFPWVMTLFTVPFTIVGLTLWGLKTRFPRFLPSLANRLGAPLGALDPARTDVLLLGSALAPLVVISMPWTPIFGGTKHWFTAYPFAMIFAGLGAQRVFRALRTVLVTRWSSLVAIVAGATLLLTPSALETVHAHPFGLSHYTLAAGGVPGAADHGMNRQFWGFTTGSLAPWLNENLPEGGSVWICDTTWTAWQMLQEDGRLARNIRASSTMQGADFAIVHHEHHFVEVDYQLWMAYGSVQPVHVMTYDGVPIISVYENPRHRARREARQRDHSSRRGPVR